MKIRHFDYLLWRVLVGVLLSGFDWRTQASPAGMTAIPSTAAARQGASQLAATVSQSTFLNRQSFNLAAGETTIFKPPSVSSLALSEKVSRVTVILPARSSLPGSSQKQTATQPL